MKDTVVVALVSRLFPIKHPNLSLLVFICGHFCLIRSSTEERRRSASVSRLINPSSADILQANNEISVVDQVRAKL